MEAAARFEAILAASPRESGFMSGPWKTKDLLAILKSSFATPWGEGSLRTFLTRRGWTPLGVGIYWERPRKPW